MAEKILDVVMKNGTHVTTDYSEELYDSLQGAIVMGAEMFEFEETKHNYKASFIVSEVSSFAVTEV